MKSFSAVFIAIIFSLSAKAQFNITISGGGVTVSAGKNSVFDKPLGAGSGSINEGITNTKKAADKALHDTAVALGTAVKDVTRETGVFISNIKNTVDIAIHDTGKNLGDAIKNIRNTISIAQGVDVDKTLKELRGQISQCRFDKTNLSALVKEIKQLKREFKTELKNNPDASTEEIRVRAQKKIDQLEILKANSGVALGIGLTSLSIGLTGTSIATVNTWATTGGFYTAVAAAVVVVMMNQVTEEIEREQKKLANCGKKYEKVYTEYEKEYSELINLLEQDKKIAYSVLYIQNSFNEVQGLYISYALGDVLPEMFYFSEKIFRLKLKISHFLADHPGYADAAMLALKIELNAMWSEYVAMEKI